MGWGWGQMITAVEAGEEHVVWRLIALRWLRWVVSTGPPPFRHGRAANFGCPTGGHGADLVHCANHPNHNGPNQTQEARVYSHDGPIRHRKRGYVLTTDQSDIGSA
eukprot:277189-Prorocentrum_minimum.AAC.1